MAYDPSNLFAKIIAGEIPSHKIFETPHAVAILDAFPLVEGHALLLPKHPCVDVTDMPPDVAASVLKELPRLARLVQQATGADGVNIVQNSGRAAGQVVFHCHFHVIPRFDSDQKPIAFGASRKSMISGDEAASVLSRMKEPYAGSLSAIEELMGEMRAGSVTKPAAAAASKPAAAKPAAKQEAKPAKQESKEKPAAAKPAKQEAKEAKDKPAKEAAPPKKAAPAADRPLDISYADIRVGKIIDAKPHPDSDKLFVETIELGEPAPRQILSGLGHHMKLEQVKGADVVCICNLKARKLAGLESNGMVLCASDAEKSNLAFVVPPPGSKPGDRVTFAGYPGEPETPKQMDKKKIWELVQPEFSTDASGTACYKGVPYSVAGGVCSSAVKNGIIS